MTNVIKKSLLILFCCCIAGLSLAATHYKNPKLADITSVDTKKRIIVLDNAMYHMSRRIKVNDIGIKFPSIRDLRAGMEVKFRTIKSRKNNRIEVREIWILPL